MDIWTYEPRRKAWDRVTFDPGDDIYPLWSPDDASIIYGGLRKDGIVNIYRKPVTGPPDSEELVVSEPLRQASDGLVRARVWPLPALRLPYGRNHGPPISAHVLGSTARGSR